MNSRRRITRRARAWRKIRTKSAKKDLISDFDKLVRSYLTARHVGLMTRDQSEEMINACARPIRHAFTVAGNWKYTGLTRTMVRQNTANVQSARSSMGEVPADVLAGERRAKLSPYIRTAGAAPVGVEDDHDIDADEPATSNSEISVQPA